MKRVIFTNLFILITLISNAQKESITKEWQNTWTYTYLKAKPDQRSNLKEFLVKNWFAMDSIAVQRGLFNDYQLLENSDLSNEAEWDYIVAVEYYTKGTYQDIQAEWIKVRNNHKTVLINGLSFPELGGVIKSDVFAKTSYAKEDMCEGAKYDILKPFIGQWHEYLVEGDQESLYGNLSIRISSESCSLSKEFSMLTSSFSYETLGYFDSSSGTWKETYTFSNGGYAIYEWKKLNEEVVMELLESSFSTELLRRNRWTNVSENTFQIISQESSNASAELTSSLFRAKIIRSAFRETIDSSESISSIAILYGST